MSLCVFCYLAILSNQLTLRDLSNLQSNDVIITSNDVTIQTEPSRDLSK